MQELVRTVCWLLVIGKWQHGKIWNHFYFVIFQPKLIFYQYFNIFILIWRWKYPTLALILWPCRVTSNNVIQSSSASKSRKLKSTPTKYWILGLDDEVVQALMDKNRSRIKVDESVPSKVNCIPSEFPEIFGIINRLAA